MNPVGHQSTNWMFALVLMAAMAAWASFGTTCPRYSKQVAMYFPFRGSHLTIWFFGSKHELVISETEFDSCWAFVEEMTGAYETNGK